MRSTKTLAPACTASSLGAVDAVLLTHDQHADNLDAGGRTLLDAAPRVITTRAATRRLRSRLGGRCTGLAPWSSTEVVGTHGGKVQVLATPARHGPPLSMPFVGEVIGFLVLANDQVRGAVYITGDTVWFAGVREVSRRHKVGTLLLHLGGAAYGPLRFSMNADEGARAARTFERATVVPVHCDGWTHFHEPRAIAEQVLTEAGVSDRVLWLDLGHRTYLPE
jgi:L-ascorbate metabolism protein UlaG (beta-lactamase superfamily)